MEPHGDGGEEGASQSGGDAPDSRTKGRGRGAGRKQGGGRGVQSTIRKEKAAPKAKAAKEDKTCFICSDKHIMNSKFCRTHERLSAAMKFQAVRDKQGAAFAQVSSANLDDPRTIFSLSCAMFGVFLVC